MGDSAEIIAYRARGRQLVIGDDMEARDDVSLEDRYGLASFDDLGRALDQGPDVVLVTNPTSRHMQVALAAAARGCHLFIEKPLSHDLEGAAELAELSRRSGTVVTVGYQLRFHPAMRTLKDMLAAGNLGRLTSARLEFGEYLPGAHGYEDYKSGYAARSELGGGVLLSLIHELDLAYWLFGMPRRLFASGGHLSGLDMDVEDSVSVLMDCGGGKGLPVSVSLDFVQRPPSRGLKVVGDQGVVEWDYYEDELRVYSAGAGEWETVGFPGFSRNQMFVDEMRHFIACLTGKQRPEVTLKEAVDGLRIVMAAKRSLETGAAVDL